MTFVIACFILDFYIGLPPNLGFGISEHGSSWLAKKRQSLKYMNVEFSSSRFNVTVYTGVEATTSHLES